MLKGVAMAVQNGAKTLTICTHDGPFHCDDVLACYILKKLDRFSSARIVRSREEAVISQADVVVDVGGVYDPATFRFDHHMRTFKETLSSVKGASFSEFRTKLSSVGLVWAHHGEAVVASASGLPPGDPRVALVYRQLYKTFLEALDAGDNGIPPCDCTPRFIQSTALPSRVGHLNPGWDEPDHDKPETFMRQFEKAMRLAGSEFDERLAFLSTSWLNARSIVEDAVRQRYEVDKSGAVLLLPGGGVPWKEHLFGLEGEGVLEPGSVLYVVYEDKGKMWRILCVPKVLGTFGDRLPLLESWRGLRDEALRAACDIPDANFVHANGFTAGAATYDGVLSMARKTLKASLGS